MRPCVALPLTIAGLATATQAITPASHELPSVDRVAALGLDAAPPARTPDALFRAIEAASESSPTDTRSSESAPSTPVADTTATDDPDVVPTAAAGRPGLGGSIVALIGFGVAGLVLI